MRLLPVSFLSDGAWSLFTKSPHARGSLHSNHDVFRQIARSSNYLVWHSTSHTGSLTHSLGFNHTKQRMGLKEGRFRCVFRSVSLNGHVLAGDIFHNTVSSCLLLTTFSSAAATSLFSFWESKFTKWDRKTSLQHHHH